MAVCGRTPRHASWRTCAVGLEFAEPVAPHPRFIQFGIDSRRIVKRPEAGIRRWVSMSSPPGPVANRPFRLGFRLPGRQSPVAAGGRGHRGAEQQRLGIAGGTRQPYRLRRAAPQPPRRLAPGACSTTCRQAPWIDLCSPRWEIFTSPRRHWRTFEPALGGLGPARLMELERESRRGGMITRRWKILCPTARLEAGGAGMRAVNSMSSWSPGRLTEAHRYRSRQ